ncbi:unnamed protein product [Acanthoscelides obtectus]|uniref:Uncharacterized protein n=1 Tax=Acanthoscelides obtectus TaxID=200917 RepID=A0A9P0PWS6_ACAOB|nr:unnamed protein product [Acanthoscelides obtectus]CAK1639309.1 hypothetical protein AOBTE_LOCUS11115 [Acanthoscelides obtectus]
MVPVVLSILWLFIAASRGEIFEPAKEAHVELEKKAFFPAYPPYEEVVPQEQVIAVTPETVYRYTKEEVPVVIKAPGLENGGEQIAHNNGYSGVFIPEQTYKPQHQVTTHRPEQVTVLHHVTTHRPEYHHEPSRRPEQHHGPTHIPEHHHESSRRPEQLHEPTHRPEHHHEPSHRPEYHHEPSHRPEYHHEPSYRPEYEQIPEHKVYHHAQHQPEPIEYHHKHRESLQHHKQYDESHKHKNHEFREPLDKYPLKYFYKKDFKEKLKEAVKEKILELLKKKVEYKKEKLLHKIFHEDDHDHHDHHDHHHHYDKGDEFKKWVKALAVKVSKKMQLFTSPARFTFVHLLAMSQIFDKMLRFKYLEQKMSLDKILA